MPAPSPSFSSPYSSSEKSTRSRQTSIGSTILSRIISKGSDIFFKNTGEQEDAAEELDHSLIDDQFRRVLMDALPESTNKNSIIEEQMKQLSIGNKLSIIKSSSNRNTLFHYLTLLEGDGNGDGIGIGIDDRNGRNNGRNNGNRISPPTRGDINSLRIEFSNQPLKWLSDFQKNGGTNLLLQWIKADSPIIKELMLALKAFTNNIIGLEEIINDPMTARRIAKLIKDLIFFKGVNNGGDHGGHGHGHGHGHGGTMEMDLKEAMLISLNILSVISFKVEKFSLIKILREEWKSGDTGGGVNGDGDSESLLMFRRILLDKEMLSDSLILANSLIDKCDDLMERIFLRWELFPNTFKSDNISIMNDEGNEGDEILKRQFIRFVNSEKDDLSSLVEEECFVLGGPDGGIGGGMVGGGDPSLIVKAITLECNNSSGIREGLTRLLQGIQLIPIGMKEGITKLLLKQLKEMILNSFQSIPLTMERIEDAFKQSKEEKQEHQKIITRLRMDNLSKEGQYRLEIDNLQRKNEILEDKVEDLVNTLKSYKEEIGDINRDALLEISMLKGDIDRLEKINVEHCASIEESLTRTPKSVPPPAPVNPKSVPPPAPVNPKSVPPPAPVNPKSVPPPAPVNPKSVPPPAPVNPKSVPPPAPINPKSVPPPAPVNPNINTKCSPPPPPQMGQKKIQLLQVPIPTVKKMKPMQWRKLAPKELENSIWMKIAIIAPKMIEKIHFKEIDSLFQQIDHHTNSNNMLKRSSSMLSLDSHKGIGDSSSQSSISIDSFISIEERMMISIILMKITHTIPILVTALNVMDSSIFTNNLSYQLKKSFEDEKFSSPQFLKELSLLEPQGSDRCEELIIRMAREVPNFPLRIKILNLKEEVFPEICNQILSLMSPYQNLFYEMEQSQSLKDILSYILILGNYVNQGTIRGDAMGFSIEYLTSLKPLRAVAPSNLTMLSYIQQSVPFSIEDLNGIYFSLCKTSKWNEVERQLIHLNEIGESIEVLSSSSKDDQKLSSFIEEFITDSTRQIATIRTRWSSLQREKDLLLLQYPSNTGIDNLLGIFTEFIGDIRRIGRKDSLKIQQQQRKTSLNSSIIQSPKSKDESERGIMDHCLDHLRGYN